MQQYSPAFQRFRKRLSFVTAAIRPSPDFWKHLSDSAPTRDDEVGKVLNNLMARWVGGEVNTEEVQQQLDELFLHARQGKSPVPTIHDIYCLKDEFENSRPEILKTWNEPTSGLSPYRIDEGKKEVGEGLILEVTDEEEQVIQDDDCTKGGESFSDVKDSKDRPSLSDISRGHDSSGRSVRIHRPPNDDARSR